MGISKYENDNYGRIRPCTLEDLDEIVRLQEVVYENMPDQTMLSITEKDEIEESLRLDKCYCAEVDGEMIAYSMLVAPRISYRNTGTYLGYDDDRLMKTATMDLSLVKPGHRGHHMQRRMIDIRLKDAKELGAEEVLSTVEPNNSHSLNNLVGSGFEIITTKVIYDGLKRNILRFTF